MIEIKSTDNLNQELMNAESLDRFLSDNQNDFRENTADMLLRQLFQQKTISKSILARQSGMSEVYLHQIFSGKRKPSRNRLLCLCFGFSTTLQETQELLKQCGHAQLYPANRRDAILIYGFLNNLCLFDINDKLFTEKLEPLC